MRFYTNIYSKNNINNNEIYLFTKNWGIKAIVGVYLTPARNKTRNK